MKKYLLILLLLIPIFCFSQDYKRVKRKNEKIITKIKEERESNFIKRITTVIVLTGFIITIRDIARLK